MREIELTKGKTTIVDDEDYDALCQFKWFTLQNHGKYYAARAIRKIDGSKTMIYMHRQILGLDDPRILVDHIDLNGLNNSRANLRLCSTQENKCNMEKLSTNTSGYKGVSWHKNRRKWYAAIKVNGKAKHLGSFATPEEAACAYDEAAQKYHGSFARTNFS